MEYIKAGYAIFVGHKYGSDLVGGLKAADAKTLFDFASAIYSANDLSDDFLIKYLQDNFEAFKQYVQFDAEEYDPEYEDDAIDMMHHVLEELGLIDYGNPMAPWYIKVLYFDKPVIAQDKTEAFSENKS